MRVQSGLLLICLLGALHAHALPEEKGGDEQRVGRRYVESTFASEMRKIMESMTQKNFVDFLLKQREKRSRRATALGDAEERLRSDLQRRSPRDRQRGHV